MKDKIREAEHARLAVFRTPDDNLAALLFMARDEPRPRA